MVTETVGGGDELREASGFLRSIAPELVVPIVVFLASRACAFTHHNYSACAGRFAISPSVPTTVSPGSPITR